MTTRQGPFLHKLIFFSMLFLIGVIVVGVLFLLQPTLVETDVFIPIESNSSSQSIQVISPQPAGLDVRVKGSEESIAALSQQSLSYPLQIFEAGKGVRTVPVDVDRIELPNGISVVQFQPPTITVRIEQRLEKSLPVEAILSGPPAMGFVVANTVIKPNRLRVVGPDSILVGLTRIPTKPVDVTGRSELFKKRVALDLPDEIELVKSEPIVIEVIFKKRKKVKTIPGIKIKGNGAEKPFRISPPTIELTIEGPDQIIGNLTADPQFDVYVDLSGLDSGVFVRRAVILLPLNTTLIKATPEVFTVHIGSENEQGG